MSPLTKFSISYKFSCTIAKFAYVSPLPKLSAIWYTDMEYPKLAERASWVLSERKGIPYAGKRKDIISVNYQ